VLSYAEYGDPAGSPILFFHGLGHDRLAVGPGCPGARLICVDRPGTGGSTRHRNRSMAAFAADVEELLDALELDSVRALAWSAGAPYALACCAAMPGRFVATTIAAGMAPPEVGRCNDRFAALMLRLASWSPRAVATPLLLMRLQAQVEAELLLRTLFANAPGCDRAALEDPAIRQMFRRTYRSATARGIGGVLDELATLTRPWDVDLGAIDGASVALVYGELDRLTPAAVGGALARLLPGCELRIAERRGHMLLWTDWEAVVGELAGRAIAVAA
jgi:pimeloyl-ACP methyl ester carboxylesterase